jgi:hypothetical protein
MIQGDQQTPTPAHFKHTHTPHLKVPHMANSRSQFSSTDVGTTTRMG